MTPLAAVTAVTEYSRPAVILFLVILAVVSYFLGCFNGAIIVSKYILRDDIRGHGSGNAGLTNFYRTFGTKLAALVLGCDMVKMVLAVGAGLLAVKLLGPPEWWTFIKYWTGLFCLLGHMFPCMFAFHGGKGILSGGTLSVMIDLRIALIVWVVFLVLFVLTRYVSLGSVCAGILFPASTWLFYPQPTVVVLSFVCGGLIVWQHRENIRRLRSGTESKLYFKK